MGCGASAPKEPALSLNFGAHACRAGGAFLMSSSGDSPAGADGDAAKEIRDSLKQADNIIQQLKSFKGCGDLVREVQRSFVR